MFKLFRRAAAPAPEPKAAAKPARDIPVTRPIPLMPDASAMEVIEDHDESAWDLWEQSQFQLDSQMGSLEPTHSVRVKDGRPSQAAELDPFSRIGKNHR